MITAITRRDIRVHKVNILLISAVFFLSPFVRDAAASDNDRQAPCYGDAIVVSSISDVRTLVPALASDSASGDICGMIFNGLIKYDKDLKIVGDLAEGWDILDGGLSIVFRLRKDVKWHDGAPFTAKDVEFTYKKLIDPDVRTPYSGDFERVKELHLLDDYTVKVAYHEPFAPALSSWGMWIMPEHILKSEDLNKTDFSGHPIGTGPYKFKSRKTGEKIELVSNHEYFEGRPYVDRYIYRIIPDEATRFLELQTQGVDMAAITPLQFTRQTDNKFFKNHYRKFSYSGFGYTYLGYNLSDPRFSDLRVRGAMNHAVNKDEIIKTVFFSLAHVTTGPFAIGSWAYNEEVEPVSFDPERAKKLLREAGWIDSNGDGWIEKEGRAFEFTVLINHGNAERLRCAEMIQSYLKAVGIRMKIRMLEWSVMINEFINKRRFDAVLMGWSLSRDPDNYNIWHSSKTREGEFNFIGYRNADVDRLLEEGRRTFDPSTSSFGKLRTSPERGRGTLGVDGEHGRTIDERSRAAIYRRIHRLIYDDQPYMFLYSADVLPIVNSRFRNVEVSPIGIGYNFIKWYVPKDEQRYR